MTPAIALRLGRVSNLPTVWSNALAGALLAGAMPSEAAWVAAAIGVSLVYVAGMFLNDAFDAEHDARMRPDRPIAAGQVSRESVFRWGYALLAAGVGAVLLAGAIQGHAPAAGVAGLVLAGLVVFYDRHHKANPFGPLVMALCRVGVYAVAGCVAAGALGTPLLAGAAMLCAHLTALTYIAKYEMAFRWRTVWPLVLLGVPIVYGATGPAALAPAAALLVADGAALFLLRRRAPGDTPRGVMTLIAAISLVDALLIARTGQPVLALAAAAGFPLTLALQRLVRGT